VGLVDVGTWGTWGLGGWQKQHQRLANSIADCASSGDATRGFRRDLVRHGAWNQALMPLYTLDELVAYRLSMDLKKQVFDLLYTTPAQYDSKFAGQVSDAAASVASNLAEGYYRFNPAEFATFVKYCRSSLQEVRTRLPDGVAKRYYSQQDIEPMLKLAERLAKVLGGLYFSLRRQAEAKRRKGRT
jgi:four helix bundle protein